MSYIQLSLEDNVPNHRTVIFDLNDLVSGSDDTCFAAITRDFNGDGWIATTFFNAFPVFICESDVPDSLRRGKWLSGDMQSMSSMITGHGEALLRFFQAINQFGPDIPDELFDKLRKYPYDAVEILGDYEEQDDGHAICNFVERIQEAAKNL